MVWYFFGGVFIFYGVLIISGPWLPTSFNQIFKILLSPEVIAPPLRIALAGFLASVGWNLLSQGRNESESVEKQSHFYLESSLQTFKEALDLLSDGNNNRTIWIAAARLLEHAKKMERKIIVDAHKHVLEAKKIKLRSAFHNLVKDKPAAFYYGVENWSQTLLEKAAEQSTAPREEKGRTSFLSTELSESSIHAVWEAGQYPRKYKDPLGKGFSARGPEKGAVAFFYDGLNAFLDYKAQWRSTAGKLYRRESHGTWLQKVKEWCLSGRKGKNTA
jgi:hypothetical protein